MKRFYDAVTIEKSDLGFHIALDGSPIRTQEGRPQAVASRALAEALAGEWRAQGDTIDPAGFSFRDMTDYALDRVPVARDDIVAGVLAFAETDTLCYRADPDEPLWHRQRAAWDPLLDEFEAREGVRLERVSGVLYRPLDVRARALLQARIARLDDFALAALEQLTALAASLCLGLTALETDADGESLWNAANLEEDWQVERWGSDPEAAARRARRRTEFLKALEFARLARS